VKTYVVGGAVRDELLGLPVQDRDHVVVGSTPEEMVAAGFKPVGKDFPVFLHPETREEYALARTERKSGRGYKGFTVHASPEVTLEEDLKRRDLTINAMAKDEQGALIDPFHGKQDLEKRILRHVSEAFAEDPVRILRVARFAARFDFEVAEETMALMRQMVESGETDHLVSERVWQEFSKGLAEKHAERMFEVLEACGLHDKLLPEITDVVEDLSGSLAVRFARITWGLEPPDITALCNRLKVPNEERDLAMSLGACRNYLESARTASAPRLLELLTAGDAFRRAARFADLLAAARMADPKLDIARVERAVQAARAVNAAEIAKKASSGRETEKLLREARVQAIQNAT